MNTSLEFALSKNLITYNPAAELQLSKNSETSPYHEIRIDLSKTYTLDQVKVLLKAAKGTKIYMYILFMVLMGLRKSEISGLKYSDIDYENHTIKISRQLGRDLNADEEKCCLIQRQSKKLM